MKLLSPIILNNNSIDCKNINILFKKNYKRLFTSKGNKPYVQNIDSIRFYNEDINLRTKNTKERLKHFKPILENDSLTTCEKDILLEEMFKNSYSNKSVQYQHVINNKAIFNMLDKHKLFYTKHINKMRFDKHNNKKSDILNIVNFVEEKNFECNDFATLAFLVFCSKVTDTLNKEDPRLEVNTLAKEMTKTFLKIYKDKNFPALKDINIYDLNINDDRICKRFFDLIQITISSLENIKFIRRKYDFSGPTSKHTSSYLKMEDVFINFIYTYPLKKENLPKIVFSENDFHLLKNNINNSSSIKIVNTGDDSIVHFNRNLSSSIILNKETLETLRKLSEQSFKINICNLNRIIKNYKVIIPNYMENNILNTRNYNDFYNKNIHNFKNATECRKEYNIQVQRACNIYETVYIAYIYRKEFLYFLPFCDSRTRAYFDGYLLQLQGDLVSKSLLHFGDELDNQNLRSHDAVCSGLQMMSLILRSESLMKFTHILPDEDNINPDFYEFIKNSYNIMVSYEVDKNNEIDLALSPTFKLSEAEKSYALANGESLIIKPFIEDRNIIKFFTIRVIYGQGIRNGIKGFTEEFKYSYPLAKYSIKRLRKILNDEVPEIKFLLDLTQKVASIKTELNEPIILYKNDIINKDLHLIMQYYAKQKNCKAYFL